MSHLFRSRFLALAKPFIAPRIPNRIPINIPARSFADERRYQPLDLSGYHDNIYRRPNIGHHKSELADGYDMIWWDGQAPEPLLDQDEYIDRFTALKALLTAFGVLGAFYGLTYITTPENPAYRQKLYFEENDNWVGQKVPEGRKSSLDTWMKPPVQRSQH